MPTISIFYGIVITMYYNDHNPPHFHAKYGNAKALVRISDGQILRGALPPTAARLVRDWAVARRIELEANWERGRTEAPFQRVAGPDGQG
jgi:Domain of unknown function (DUF4160)